MGDEIISWNPGPFNHPLRKWKDTDPSQRTMVRSQVQIADAEDALRALLAGEEVTDAHQAAFGRANYHAYLATYEPIFHFIHGRIIVADEVRKMLTDEDDSPLPA